MMGIKKFESFNESDHQHWVLRKKEIIEDCLMECSDSGSSISISERSLKKCSLFYISISQEIFGHDERLNTEINKIKESMIKISNMTKIISESISRLEKMSSGKMKELSELGGQDVGHYENVKYSFIVELILEIPYETE